MMWRAASANQRRQNADTGHRDRSPEQLAELTACADIAVLEPRHGQPVIYSQID